MSYLMQHKNWDASDAPGEPRPHAAARRDLGIQPRSRRQLGMGTFTALLGSSYLKDLKCVHRQGGPRSQTWCGRQHELSEAVLALCSERTGYGRSRHQVVIIKRH